MTKIVWHPTLTPVVEIGQPDTYPGVWAKLVDEATVRGFKTEIINKIADEMLKCAGSGYRYYLWDVKDHRLVAGQSPGNGLWHGDSSLNADEPHDNFLYVSGSHALTEFASEPVQTDRAKSGPDLNRMVAAAIGAVVRIRSGVIHRYDEKTLHRSVSATGAERRLLVRLSCTNRRPIVGPTVRILP